jgi:Lrp/AsnC family transcriptional regulator, regulator for asnA, asnC and gidA
VTRPGPGIVDDLDFKIFKAIEFRPYGPSAGDLSRLNPWVIAKKVGADGATVKLRLDKMKRGGFIHYFQIYPNFRLLGLSAGAYEFDLPDVVEKSAAIEKCALVDGVIEIHNFIGPTICIDFAYLDGRDEGRRLELLRQLTRCGDPEKFYERDMPPVDIELSNVDWRIIKALRYHALNPLSQVARELGLSPKTVRRRFERMTRHGAVIIVPVINPADIPNTVTHTLLLYPTLAQREEVLARALGDLGPATFLSRTAGPGNAMLCLAARTISETEENLIKARRIPGMKDAKLLVLKEIREYTQWLDAAIERKIAETSRTGESSAPGPSPVVERGPSRRATPVKARPSRRVGPGV